MILQRGIAKRNYLTSEGEDYLFPNFLNNVQTIILKQFHLCEKKCLKKVLTKKFTSF